MEVSKHERCGKIDSRECSEEGEALVADATGLRGGRGPLTDCNGGNDMGES